jgi:hypothetical protein
LQNPNFDHWGPPLSLAPIVHQPGGCAVAEVFKICLEELLLAEEPHQIFLFRPKERDNVYPLPVKSGNELTEIFHRPPFAPRLAAADENPNGTSLAAPASQLFYSSFSLLAS